MANKKNAGLYQSPYDPRDYKLKDLLPLGAFQIPENFQTEDIPFIYDQGESSECAACAYNNIRFLQEREQSGLTEKFSPSFNYGNRLDGETFEGMYLRSVCSKGREGSVLYKELPGFYTAKVAINKVKANKAELLKKAKPFAISSYYTCNSRKEVQTAIITCKGVMVGIPILNCLIKPKNGTVIYNPKKDVQSYGGHAVTITGWKTEQDGSFYWRLLNSWGDKWGDHGYVWLPESYPWIDKAYVIVDEIMEMQFNDYKKQYYGIN